jgi:hypothetical protein
MKNLTFTEKRFYVSLDLFNLLFSEIDNVKDINYTVKLLTPYLKKERLEEILINESGESYDDLIFRIYSEIDTDSQLGAIKVLNDYLNSLEK